MESQQPRTPALPLLALLAIASALGVAVAVALAGVAMLLAAPAYAGDGSLLLERRGAMAEAKRLSAEVESQEEGEAVMTRVVQVYRTHHALLTRRRSLAVVEPMQALGPGETLIVELVYRTRRMRRVLALR